MNNAQQRMFSSLIGSTLWRNGSKDARLIWITMLALADRSGLVDVSLPALANFANVTVEEADVAIVSLLLPDPLSRTPDNDGRRLSRVLGGWRILNYDQHSKKLAPVCRREYMRNAKRESRSRMKLNGERAASPTAPKPIPAKAVTPAPQTVPSAAASKHCPLPPELLEDHWNDPCR